MVALSPGERLLQQGQGWPARQGTGVHGQASSSVEAAVALPALGCSSSVVRNLAILDEDRLDFELLEALVAHIDESNEGQEGSILVFLPGQCLPRPPSCALAVCEVPLVFYKAMRAGGLRTRVPATSGVCSRWQGMWGHRFLPRGRGQIAGPGWTYPFHTARAASLTRPVALLPCPNATNMGEIQELQDRPLRSR